MNKKTSQGGLFISPSSSLGGAERVLLDNLRSWKTGDLGPIPEVAFVEDGPLINIIKNMGFQVRWIPISKALLRIGDSPARSENKLIRFLNRLGAFPFFLLTIIKWRYFLKKFRPAWIHSNGFKSHLLSSWASEKNQVIFWHLHDFVSGRSLMKKLLVNAWRPGISALAISDAVAEDFHKHVPMCPVKVWKNTVNFEKFNVGLPEVERLDLLSKAVSGNKVCRVGLVASYARWKGHDVFINAARLLQGSHISFHFYIVGGPIYQSDGSQWSQADLEKLVNKLGLRTSVSFIPFQENSEWVYRSLDIVVHASIRPEPFGLVIAEAMACGVSVVAALHGGAAEIGEDGVHCLGHIPGDPNSLANAIQKLANDDVLRIRLCNKALEHVAKTFDANQNPTRWMSLMKEVICF